MRLLSTSLCIALCSLASISYGAPAAVPPATPNNPASLAATNPSSSTSVANVIDQVNAAGYPIVTSVELGRGVYKVKAINQYGNRTSLRVDMKGQVLSHGYIAPKLSLAAVAQKLESQGYRIEELEMKRSYYQAEVLDSSGNKQQFNINPANGDISS